MNENPVALVVMIAVGVYVAWLWWCDRKTWTPENADSGGPLPGAAPAPTRALWIAAGGAALILAGETWAEIALGLDDEQSKVTLLFGAYTLVAAIIEEVIFRGFVVVDKKGPRALYGSILAASVLFALMHPFLWSWDDGFALTLTPKGWLSFIAVFIGSLWFYACRFASWNPHRSLLPCFVAHLTKNAGVLIIKYIQGHVVGAW
jgi:membrane protease YdiL (CAAX protease family)